MLASGVGLNLKDFHGVARSFFVIVEGLIGGLPGSTPDLTPDS